MQYRHFKQGDRVYLDSDHRFKGRFQHYRAAEPSLGISLVTWDSGVSEYVYTNELRHSTAPVQEPGPTQKEE